MEYPPTPEQRADAVLHATAWEDVWDQMSTMAERAPPPIDRGQLGTLAVFAMTVASAYRKVVNGKDLVE